MTGYGKRSISVEFTGFCGWDKLVSTTKTLDQTVRSLFSTLFETGGRANEVLSLTPEKFKEYDGRGVAVVTGMKVLKHRKASSRTFPIRMDDKLYEPMMETVRVTKPDQLIFPYKYRWLYGKITSIDKGNNNFGEWFPHRLRGERASQLVSENRFGVIELMQFFNWKNSEMPTFYAKLSPEDLIRRILEGKL